MIQDPEAEKDIKTTLDFFHQILFQSPSFDWCFPMIMEDVTHITTIKGHAADSVDDQSSSKAKANWGNGVAGVVYLFAKAGLHYKSHG
jgi:hypothetical protein